MEGNFLEKCAVKSEVPADINGSGLTGARVDMSKTYKLAIKVNYASAAAGADITLLQHDAASGGTSKALSISNAYYKSLAGAAFTKEEISGVSNITDADLNGSAGVIVVEINAEDLDVNNGFSFVSANLADPAVARVVAVDYVGHNLRVMPGYDQVL